jgi:hypothetical protein
VNEIKGLSQIPRNSIEFLSNSSLRSEFQFSFEIR